jgi:lysyl-tRNA synthetase class II
MVESLISGIAHDVLGSLRLTYKGDELDFTPPWRRASMRDLLIKHAGFDWDRFRDLDALREEVRAARRDAQRRWGAIDEVLAESFDPADVRAGYRRNSALPAQEETRPGAAEYLQRLRIGHRAE